MMNTFPNPNKQRGNILVTLLFIASIAVIGMMALIYNELTKTPQLTEEAYERQQQVEILTPNTQKTNDPIYRPATKEEQQIHQVEQNTTAVLAIDPLNKSNTTTAKPAATSTTAETKITEIKPINIQSEPVKSNAVKPEKTSENKKAEPIIENNKTPIAVNTQKPANEKSNKGNEAKSTSSKQNNAIDELF